MGSLVAEMLVQAPQQFSQSPQGRVAGPTGIWDHVIVFVSVMVVLAALYLCIRFFILPKEKDGKHIKYTILRDDVTAGPGESDER